MTVTVTNLSFEKKKKKKKERKGGKSTLFYSGGAQPENSILRQQWRGKYLSKDQRWQSETHYKTMADCLPAWLLGWLSGAVGLPWAAMLLFVRGEKRRQRHTSSSRSSSPVTASLIPPADGSPMIPLLQSVACDVVPLQDNNMDVAAEMTGRDIKVLIWCGFGSVFVV